MQSGKYTLDAREVDLDEILQVVARLLQADRGRGAAFGSTAGIDPELPTVRGDPAKLRRSSPT